MAIDKTIDFCSCFAQGTIARGMAFISDEVVFIVNASNGEAFTFVDAGENRANACGDAVIIADGIDSGLNGIACGNGRRQNQHVLADDHGCDIIAEDDLASARIFGGDHVNGAVRVHIHVSRFCQFACHASADHFRAVKTQDRIHYLGKRNFAAHDLGACARFGKTMLGHGEIDIIIQMAVCGCKMTSCNTKRKICVLVTIFDQFNGHNILLLRRFAKFRKSAFAFSEFLENDKHGISMFCGYCPYLTIYYDSIIAQRIKKVKGKCDKAFDPF